MKKIGLLVLLMMILIVPFTVFAEEESEKKEDSKEVNVYFFRGEGCSHCAEAEEWFKSIEEELGDRFEIIDYETWYNEDNSELMKKVAKARGESEQATGVPYIIVGDKSWIGFTDDYKEEIKSQINAEYGKDVNKRYDVIELLGQKSSDKDSSSDVAALIIILLVVGGVGFGIYKARGNTN